ncbi:hypothetical protein F0562_025109 [Nyssa sinensis]|uniref:Retrotransposon gag domain-containing protein n=1 Tax=Nyssa sinensis TaxID=561372 RepID=A0A5J5BD85_9ASTE|nr:hypothetical protein F0562_025109 [Nyssa sinensis]
MEQMRPRHPAETRSPRPANNVAANGHEDANIERPKEEQQEVHPPPGHELRAKISQPLMFEWARVTRKISIETHGTASDITKNVRMEVLDFEDKITPTVFFDWKYVAEYRQKFDELKTRSQVVEGPSQTLAQYKARLRLGLRKELLCQPLFSLEHVSKPGSLDMEEYLSNSIPRKFGSLAGETAPKKFNNGYRFRPSGLKQSSSNMVDPKG